MVNDNVTNTSMLVAMLEPLGFRIYTADNGREALRAALEQLPDLVLMDLVMPEMDGLDTAQEMRRLSELDGTRIIGISATVTDSVRKGAFIDACDDFMAKPLSLDLLLDKIGAHLQLVWEVAGTKQVSATPVEAQDFEEPVEVPPAEELVALHKLALMGDMQGIRNWAARLEEREQKYGRFAGLLRDLASRFKVKAIVALVEQYMRGRA